MAATATVVARLAPGARRAPAMVLEPRRQLPGPVSVVIPARNEEHRLGRALAALVGDPQVVEVVVVDDCSTDGTAEVAAAAGARVVAGRPLPGGWVGKPWALQQGLEASTGEWLVTLDADVEPRPGLVGALVGRADEEGWDHLSAGGRFVCDTAGQRFLHPAMLATLVYRFGAPGDSRPPPPWRVVANGQCTVTRRAVLAAQGGYRPIAGHLTDDVALARHLAGVGWRVGFFDGSRLFDVRMHTSAGDVWRDWGRSLPMADVTSARWKAADLAVVWLAQALPLPRLLAGRADGLDVAMATARLGVLAATAGVYRERGSAYWCSPLLDVAVAARLTWGTLRPGTTWRGRTYARRLAGPAQ
ncbi:MAG: glycosyltransferase family 2 protein [Actinomycetota bacterium]|nr:glycosyltransferase family 2 protein [Actinomycetota bacterium]